MTKFYETTKQNSRKNCALERAIIETNINTFLFDIPQPSVWLGLKVSSNFFVKNNKKNIEMTRHNGVCGAMYFNGENIKINLLVPDDGNGYSTPREWVKKSLEDLGVTTTALNEKDSRLFIGDKKIMGLTITKIGDKNFISMYLLLKHDFETTAEVLTSTDGQSVTKENSIGINQATDINITIEQVKSSLKARFFEFFGEDLVDSKLPKDIINRQNYNFDNIFNQEWWIKYGRLYE